MRSKPGKMEARCIACGGQLSAVRIGRAAIIPMCDDCDRTPAEAWLFKHGDQNPVK